MPEIDLRESGKQFTTAIQTTDDKAKRLNTLIATMYQGSANMNQRRLIVRYREEYGGVHNYWYQVFATDQNKTTALFIPAAADPGLGAQRT